MKGRTAVPGRPPKAICGPDCQERDIGRHAPGGSPRGSLATTEPIAGYMLSAGLVRGSASRLPSGRPCSARGCSTGVHRADDREPVEHRRLLRQVLAKETPGSLVGITPKGPRFWSGRSGLGSQVSMWLGPPAIQSRITACSPAVGGRPRTPAHGSGAGRAGSAPPSRQPRLEHVAAADDEALRLQRVEAEEDMPVVVPWPIAMAHSRSPKTFQGGVPQGDAEREAMLGRSGGTHVTCES